MSFVSFCTHRCCYDITDESKLAVTEEDPFKEGEFDLVIDKGTLDAILVEGSCAAMLANIHRLLACDGVYSLFSIHNRSVLQSLMAISDLQFDCRLLKEIGQPNFKQATACICMKKGSTPPMEALINIQREEKRILDEYFKGEEPFLSSEMSEQLRNRYESFGVSSVPLAVIHEWIGECSSPLLGYSFDLFLEDVKSFSLKERDRMNYEEVVKFLLEMQ